MGKRFGRVELNLRGEATKLQAGSGVSSTTLLEGPTELNIQLAVFMDEIYRDESEIITGEGYVG